MGNTCTHIGKKNDEINFLNVPNFMKKILKLLRREHKRPKRHIMFFNKTILTTKKPTLHYFTGKGVLFLTKYLHDIFI